MKQILIDKIHALLFDFDPVTLEAIYTALVKISGRSEKCGTKTIHN